MCCPAVLPTPVSRGSTVHQMVRTLSEGQKGLMSLACLTLQKPSILIMDEPTNHINFRHLPALANAVKTFKGPVLMVSHDPSSRRVLLSDPDSGVAILTCSLLPARGGVSPLPGSSVGAGSPQTRDELRREMQCPHALRQSRHSVAQALH